MYLPSQSYRVRRRICYILADASTYLDTSVHLVIRKPALFSILANMRVFAGEALVGKSADLGGCTWLDRDGILR